MSLAVRAVSVERAAIRATSRWSSAAAAAPCTAWDRPRSRHSGGDRAAALVGVLRHRAAERAAAPRLRADGARPPGADRPRGAGRAARRDGRAGNRHPVERGGSPRPFGSRASSTCGTAARSTRCRCSSTAPSPRERRGACASARRAPRGALRPQRAQRARAGGEPPPAGRVRLPNGPRCRPRPAAPTRSARSSTRAIVFGPGPEAVECAVFARDELPPGTEVRGPG